MYDKYDNPVEKGDTVLIAVKDKIIEAVVDFLTEDGVMVVTEDNNAYIRLKDEFVLLTTATE